jgi:hypothetical protein
MRWEKNDKVAGEEAEKVLVNRLGFPSPEQLRAMQDGLIARLSKAARRLPLAEVETLCAAIEDQWPKGGAFQSATGGLAVALMRQYGVKVRVAEWHIVDGRCEHKRYAVGSTTRARCGEVEEGQTWLEAWIA